MVAAIFSRLLDAPAQQLAALRCRCLHMAHAVFALELCWSVCGWVGRWVWLVVGVSVGVSVGVGVGVGV